MEKRFYKYNKGFKLESGEVLPELDICYHISKGYGDSAGCSSNGSKPVVWIAHALTANSDPSQWWDTLVGRGKFFDPNEYTIVCANIIGSCYGTTGAASHNPDTNSPYMLSFPKTTIRDVVACHELLRCELGIQQIDLLIGGSVGGFQAIEWSIICPQRIKNVALLACNDRITPWGNAYNESGRMSLYADESFARGEYALLEEPDSNGLIYEIHSGKKGLAAARSLALISYRSYQGYNISQAETDIDVLYNHRAQSYQQYQGEKLVKRFDAYSYLSMLDMYDSHNIGRSRGGVEQALKLIKARVICIGIDTDCLFPPLEQQRISELVDDGSFCLIHSVFGHDGFLLEWKQIQDAISIWWIKK